MFSSPLLELFFSLMLSVVSFCNLCQEKGERIVKKEKWRWRRDKDRGRGNDGRESVVYCVFCVKSVIKHFPLLLF